MRTLINITAELDEARYRALMRLGAYRGVHYENGWMTYLIELPDGEEVDAWVSEHATAGFKLSKKEERRLAEDAMTIEEVQ